ncbi:MAG: hypothetical protein HRT69_11855 [Flavobacteriaceae bacterium]|nr:hypothetical protein [Flavobacteriaceae bacterium]
MKITKYVLFFSFVLILIGIIGKSVTIFLGAKVLLVLGLVLYLLTGFIYGIITLVKRKHRIEAGMIALASPLVFGILFKLMYWPGGSLFVIIGSQVLLFGSIGMLIYSLSKNRKSILGILFLTIGLCGLFFCFKIMHWPGATLLFIPVAISIIVALIFLIKKKAKIDLSKMVSLIVITLVIILFISRDSQLFRFQHIYPKQASFNAPENYHIYAWMLYKEGKKDEAKVNLQLAIQEAQNPNNTQLNNLEDDKELTIERYKRAMGFLISNKWDEKESPINDSY